MKTKEIIKTIIIIGISFLLVLLVARASNNEDANISFCNEQGWSYSSGDAKDRVEIWCGVMTNDNGEYGFQGVTYQVEKKFFGGYKVEDGFDVNMELKQQRFEKYCDEKCEEDGTFSTAYNFERLECECVNLSNYDTYTITPIYKDILDEQLAFQNLDEGDKK